MEEQMATNQRPSALVIAVGLLVFSPAAIAQQAAQPAPKSQPAAPAPKHVLLTPDQLQFGPAPESLPAGAQVMEYFAPEIATAAVLRSTGLISFDCKATHSSLATVEHTHNGLVRM
jgi:hypothetical protein